MKNKKFKRNFCKICKTKKEKSVKSLRYMDEFFSRLMSFHYLKVVSYK